MKKVKMFMIVFLMFLFSAATVNAADVYLKWNPVSGATGYKIYSSGDMGMNWDAGLDVANVSEYTTTGVAEDRMVLFKVSAYNANGESVSNWMGAWYDHRKLPLGYADGLGIE